MSEQKKVRLIKLDPRDAYFDGFDQEVVDLLIGKDYFIDKHGAMSLINDEDIKPLKDKGLANIFFFLQKDLIIENI